MTNFLQRYATPLVTGLFLVSLISGIALFVHWQTGAFKGMHEWLSMVLIVPFVLHIWKNWRPMTVYFAKPAFAAAMALSLVAAAAFTVPGGEGGAGGPPPLALSHVVIQNNVAIVAPLLGKTPEALIAELGAAGIAVTDATKSLADIATASGKSEFQLMDVLVHGGN